MNKTNFFGTAGIRATAGKYPLNFETLPKIGSVLANFLINKYGENPKILIACDTRVSGYIIKSLLKSGLLTKQVSVYDTQVLSTPAVIYLVHELKNYDAGIIITASHNPYKDNGIKLIDRISGNLGYEEELEISHAILNFNSELDLTNPGKEFHVKSTTETYIQKILDQFSTQDFKKSTVVVDCANGATSSLVTAIFSKLGIKAIIINSNPNGTNINANCGATHPAILQKTVLKYGAQLGFALDGDGDRIVAVTSNGEIKDGDELIAFLLTNPRYENQTSLVGTIVSNLGLELWLNQTNKKLIRTDVGEKNLLVAMQANECLIGGEPSGHIILKDFAKHSDGILVALRTLQTALITNNWDLKTFTRTPQVNSNVVVKIKKDLNQAPVLNAINKYQALIQPGRLIVRYSGTENLLRLLLEGPDKDYLEQILPELKKELTSLLD